MSHLGGTLLLLLPLLLLPLPLLLLPLLLLLLLPLLLLPLLLLPLLLLPLLLPPLLLPPLLLLPLLLLPPVPGSVLLRPKVIVAKKTIRPIAVSHLAQPRQAKTSLSPAETPGNILRRSNERIIPAFSLTKCIFIAFSGRLSSSASEGPEPRAFFYALSTETDTVVTISPNQAFCNMAETRTVLRNTSS